MIEGLEDDALEWVLNNIFRKPHTKDEYDLLQELLKEREKLDGITA